MNKVNYAALVVIAIAVFSIFMPWVQVTAAAGTYDLSQSFQPITISGIAIGYGIIGLLIALLGAFLAYKDNKWTFVAGIANVIDGYGYLHGWFGAATHDSGNYGDVTSRSIVDFKLGLYLFILASLAFVFFTLKNFKSKTKVQPLEKDIWWDTKGQPAATQHIPTPVYQPSKIQTMTTTPPETPESTETPKVPVPPVEKATEQPAATPAETEAPAAPVQPVEVPAPTVPAPTVVTPAPTPVKPVQAVVNEPSPIIPQAPREQQPVYQPEKKKSSTSWIMIVILAIVLVGAGLFVFMNNTSEKSKDKTEQSVNDEKARLQVIINEVNQDVSDKKYDDALLKINSINWLYEPDANKGYVDQYNSQRENLRNTIEQMKTNQGMQDQQEASEKAAKAAEQSEQKADSVH